MSAKTTTDLDAQKIINLEERLGAHNYHPLGVVIAQAEGAWVKDVAGRRYLDCLSAYSSLNQGHAHPKILEALIAQAKRVTLTSRAFHNDMLGLFYQRLVALTGMSRVLPMNSGTEAVETALKAARKWGHDIKNIPPDQAEIIVCENNFHGRSITVVSFSTESLYRDGYGPFTPGFRSIPFGDTEALEAAITPRTCAFLVEPIQCEAGVRVPRPGFLRDAAAICREHGVLLMLDEIQTGLGRTGKMFAFEHEGIRPDVLILGKALSGGYYPVSAVLATDAVMGVFSFGSHGSTYGGNPLACAVAIAALDVLEDENLVVRAADLGAMAFGRLRAVRSPNVVEIRGQGLMVGIELATSARPFCEALFQRGVLCKETHENVIRFAPPLVVSVEDLNWGLDQLIAVLEG